MRKVSKNLPYVLDIMAICVQTGMTIEASFAYLAKELKIFDKDLCYQISKTSESGRVLGIEKALHDLSQRLPAPEINSFVLTIIQNLHYGASVAGVLSDLAEDMRRIHLLEVEERMGKLSAKMSVAFDFADHVSNRHFYSCTGLFCKLIYRRYRGMDNENNRRYEPLTVFSYGLQHYHTQ